MLRVLLALGLIGAAAPFASADNKLAEKMTGTWVREVEGHTVTLDVRADGIRFTVELPDGVTVAAEADYLVSKDGVLLGIVRTKAGKAENKDAIRERTFGGLIAVTDKTLTVKEFECPQDDVEKLVVGTFNRPGRDAVAKSPRKAAAKKAPVTAGMTLPSPRYLERAPQYFPESPSFPLNRELNKMEASPAIIKSERCEPTTLLEFLADYFFGGFFINEYSSDPKYRIQQLINQSEDLRQIDLEFEKSWFVDQPSHITYERIHGGIQ